MCITLEYQNENDAKKLITLNEFYGLSQHTTNNTIELMLTQQNRGWKLHFDNIDQSITIYKLQVNCTIIITS